MDNELEMYKQLEEEIRNEMTEEVNEILEDLKDLTEFNMEDLL